MVAIKIANFQIRTLILKPSAVDQAIVKILEG
jgi:hypothetical protein